MPRPAPPSTATPRASRADWPRVVNIFDPDVIVLGGGLSQLGHLYEHLPDLMAPYIFADAPIVTSGRPNGATPAASAARRGSGKSRNPEACRNSYLRFRLRSSAGA